MLCWLCGYVIHFGWTVFWFHSTFVFPHSLGFRFLDHETHAPYNTHTLPVCPPLPLEPFPLEPSPLLESLSCSQSINLPSSSQVHHHFRHSFASRVKAYLFLVDLLHCRHSLRLSSFLPLPHANLCITETPHFCCSLLYSHAIPRLIDELYYRYIPPPISFVYLGIFNNTPHTVYYLLLFCCFPRA